MKYFLFILTFFSLVSCGLDRPKICEVKYSFSKIVLEPTKIYCERKSVSIYEKKELVYFFDEICKSEKIFILNTQGDLWYVNIYIDGLEHKLLSLTKTVHGTYYFRDKHGTYSNDELAKRIVELTGVECEGDK